MEYDDIFNKLQFSKEWLDLGIITPEILAKLKEEFETSGDKSTEHYRWRAFTKFLKANPILPSETFFALYSFGENDPDELMGGAMMRNLIDRPDCPVELIKIAAQSERGFLVKAANSALSRRLKQ